MTKYVILRRMDSVDGDWTEIGRQDATSPARALRALNVAADTYVAVPERSWQPLTVKTEQVTKVTIG